MRLSQEIKLAYAAKKVREDIAKNKNDEIEGWKIWNPYPIQKKLIDCRADIIGFGGSGGGGKSAGLILRAYINHKKVLMIRKTYPNLKEIIERSREIFNGSGGSYNSIEKLWRLPEGRLIEFGAIQHIKDRENYRGREHDGLLIDEVTELPGGKSTLLFLSGWVRSPDPNQDCSVVCTFNPPSTPEGEWVKEFWGPWIDPEHPSPANDGEVRWFAMINGVDTEVGTNKPFEHDGEIIEPKSRTFIRATLDDNPALANSGYRATLQSLPEPLRSQLLYGDMSITSEDHAWQVIPTDWVEQAFRRWDAASIAIKGSTHIGVDVARGGSDQTILAMRENSYFLPLQIYPGTNTPDGSSVAAQVVKHYHPGCRINIDVVGVGASVYDILKNTYPNVAAIGGGESSNKTDKSKKLAFFNKRAELYWLLREALDPESGDNICLPRDNKLKTELCSARWSLVPPSATHSGQKGRIKVESKDDIKKRIGRSPDRADAVCYAWDKGISTQQADQASAIW